MFPEDITKLIHVTGIIVSMETIFLLKENNKNPMEDTWEHKKSHSRLEQRSAEMCVLYPAVVNRRCLGRCIRTIQVYGNAAPEILSALAVLDSKISWAKGASLTSNAIFFLYILLLWKALYGTMTCLYNQALAAISFQGEHRGTLTVFSC